MIRLRRQLEPEIWWKTAKCGSIQLKKFFGKKQQLPKGSVGLLCSLRRPIWRTQRKFWTDCCDCLNIGWLALLLLEKVISIVNNMFCAIWNGFFDIREFKRIIWCGMMAHMRAPVKELDCQGPKIFTWIKICTLKWLSPFLPIYICFLVGI